MRSQARVIPALWRTPPSSRCSSPPRRGRPLRTPERCNTVSFYTKPIIYVALIANCLTYTNLLNSYLIVSTQAQEPAPENPGEIISAYHTNFYIANLSIYLLPPGPHLNTPQPPLHSQEGEMREPTPAPRVKKYTVQM